jgi:hypothetical protein
MLYISILFFISCVVFITTHIAQFIMKVYDYISNKDDQEKIERFNRESFNTIDKKLDVLKQHQIRLENRIIENYIMLKNSKNASSDD